MFAVVEDQPSRAYGQRADQQRPRITAPIGEPDRVGQRPRQHLRLAHIGQAGEPRTVVRRLGGEVLHDEAGPSHPPPPRPPDPAAPPPDPPPGAPLPLPAPAPRPHPPPSSGP